MVSTHVSPFAEYAISQNLSPQYVAYVISRNRGSPIGAFGPISKGNVVVFLPRILELLVPQFP